MDLLLPGLAFEGLKNLIISEVGSQLKDVAVDKVKSFFDDKKLEEAFYKCGDYASHFENTGTDEFGQHVLLTFSKDNLLALYHKLKNETGYAWQSYIKNELTKICDSYGIDASNYVELFILLYLKAIYESDRALYLEIYLGDWRKEENQNFDIIHNNEELLLHKVSTLQSSVDMLLPKKNEESADGTESRLCIAPVTSKIPDWKIVYPHIDIYWSSEEKRVKAIKQLTEQWKAEREAAPSTFVFPYSKRATLRAYTSHFDNMIHTCKTASTEEMLDFAYELVWRYEHGFSSYSAKFVESVQKIFDDGWKEIEAAESTESKGGIGANAVKRSNQLFLLGTFLLREYREELNSDEWGKVYKLLERRPICLSDETARLKFEYIKLLFAQMKISEARSELLRFSCAKLSYEMRIRVAGLKAECGFLIEAKKELNAIEKDLASCADDVKAGSLLGALYCLQSFVVQAINPLEKGAELKRIWEKEEGFRAYFDFSNERLNFERELNRNRKRDAESEPFELTRENRTLIMGMKDYNANYDFYRFLDACGLPLHLGYVNLLDDDISDFVVILIRQFRYIGWQTLLRLGSTKTAEKLLTRKEIKYYLETEFLNTTFDYVYEAVDRNLVDSNNHGNAYGHVLSNGLFVLQRLSSVADREQQKKLIDLMCKLIDKDVVKEPRILDKWIIDVLKATDEHVKAECLNKLLNCSTKERNHYSNEDVLDPFDAFSSFVQARSLYEHAYIAPQTIDELLEKAGKSENDRKHLISRLEQLNQFNMLSSEQKRKFSELLWKDTKDETLPYAGRYYPSFFLRCPAPDGVNVVAIIKKRLMNPLEHKKLRDIELSSFSFGAYQLWKEINSVNRENSDFWTNAELGSLLKEFIEYWNVLKCNFKNSEHKSFYENEVQSRIRSFLWVVTSFNRTQVLALDDCCRLLQVAKEIGEYGMPSIQLKVFATKNISEELESEVINGLRSPDEAIVESAFSAASLLMECGNEKILHEIMIICLYRKEPGLRSALNVLHNILYRGGKIDDIKLMQEILFALAIQSDDIKYSSEKNVKRIIFTRTCCANLAYQFYLYETRNALPHSEATLEWKNICTGTKSKNEFAEVCNCWME